MKREDDPLDPDPPAALRPVLDAIRHLEGAVTGAEGIAGLALRYGGFYGPGTSLSLDPVGEHVELVRERKFPIVGGGTGVWSFIHTADAAAATVAAIEHGEPGVYNVVDDEPARVSEWLPGLASAVGAKPPRRVPRWLCRILAGEAATVMMTEIRGSSNEKAKRDSAGSRPTRRGARASPRGSSEWTTGSTRSCAREPSRSRTGCSAP